MGGPRGHEGCQGGSRGSHAPLSCVCGAVSDLAPGQSGLDEMKLLEQRAEALAAEAQRDTPRPTQQVLFVR